MKKSNTNAATAPAARKSRAPRHRGINSPKNMPKGFRTHGNSLVIKYSM